MKSTSTITIQVPIEMKNALLNIAHYRKINLKPDATITNVVIEMLKQGLKSTEKETKDL